MQFPSPGERGYTEAWEVRGQVGVQKLPWDLDSKERVWEEGMWAVAQKSLAPYTYFGTS